MILHAKHLYYTWWNPMAKCAADLFQKQSISSSTWWHLTAQPKSVWQAELVLCYLIWLISYTEIVLRSTEYNHGGMAIVCVRHGALHPKWIPTPAGTLFLLSRLHLAKEAFVPIAWGLLEDWTPQGRTKLRIVWVQDHSRTSKAYEGQCQNRQYH